MPASDPFGIKACLLGAIASGDAEAITALSRELTAYKDLYGKLMENGIVAHRKRKRARCASC